MFQDFLNLKQEARRTKCRKFHLSLYSKKELPYAFEGHVIPNTAGNIIKNNIPSL